METTIEYWGYIRIMEKKMETTLGPETSRSEPGIRRSYSPESLRSLNSEIDPK